MLEHLFVTTTVFYNVSVYFIPDHKSFVATSSSLCYPQVNIIFCFFYLGVTFGSLTVPTSYALDKIGTFMPSPILRLPTGSTLNYAWSQQLNRYV